jgi:hypothetical protein
MWSFESISGRFQCGCRAGLPLILGAVALMAGVVRAQAPGSYGPGRMMGGWAILRIKSVQAELKATPEQARKLDALFQDMLTKGQKEDARLRDAPPGQRGALFTEFQQAQEQDLRRGLVLLR